MRALLALYETTTNNPHNQFPDRTRNKSKQRLNSQLSTVHDNAS